MRPVVLVGLIPFLFTEIAKARHFMEYVTLTVLSAVRIFKGIVVCRVRKQNNQERRLCCAHLTYRMAKVEAGSRSYAVGAATEVDAVQIQLHNFVLGITPLHMECPPQLFDLTPETAVAAV